MKAFQILSTSALEKNSKNAQHLTHQTFRQWLVAILSEEAGGIAAIFGVSDWCTYSARHNSVGIK